METIHIALPSDQNYVIGLEATAGSIAYHASKEVQLLFHVLDGGINDDTFSEMAGKIKQLHPNVEFHRIAVDEALFKNYPVWSGNKMTYARLLLTEALPDVSHIIYSDTDFLWLIDIAELWRERSEEKIFIGVQDHESTIDREARWAAEHNMKFDRDYYFGAGLSFYNLDKFREESIPAKVARFLSEHPDVEFADQTALNYLLHGRVTFVDKKWQTLSIELSPDTIRKPLAIHYGGDIPWRRDRFWTIPISDSTLLWYAMMDYINGDRPGTLIRSHLTPWQRFYKRSLANIWKRPIARRLFSSALRLSGRSSYIINFNQFAINLRMSAKDIRQRAMNKSC